MNGKSKIVNRKKSRHYSQSNYQSIQLVSPVGQPSNLRRRHPGFTLVELLIVITIIGILASLVLVSFSNAQQRARDSQRKSDLDALKKSIELAKQDSPGAYSYPADMQTLDDNSTPYIKHIPTDPKTAADYIYQPLSITNGACTDDCAKFTLTACIENKSDSQKDKTVHSSCTDTGASYTVTSN